jgi:hypothetical protein
MHELPTGGPAFPLPLDAYGAGSPAGLLATLADRVALNPFNAVTTTIFVLAIVHTFVASKFSAWAHEAQSRADGRARATGRPFRPSFRAELLHFLGEIEVVFSLWAVVLVVAIVLMRDWPTARTYLTQTVNYTEPLFVVVIMALASTRPIITLAENTLRRVAKVGGGTPAAWWFVILTIGPMFGSFVTEPGAMTICALLLARQFYDLQPSWRLKMATVGLLFVNVSIGGTLTHFAAPPILMVARTWDWDTAFVLGHFGWRAFLAVLTSNVVYFLVFRAELTHLGRRPPNPDVDRPDDESTELLSPVPWWVTTAHVLFMAWTVANSHYPPLFIGGFLFFLGFVKATSPYQSRVELRGPMLVGFFLAGLVIHGGLQAWWIAPVLASLGEFPLYMAATILTSFNDNALITYLATLVPNLSDSLKMAVVEGAVTGGGLTVIANAPNPAGYALLSRFFGGSIPPLGLALAALVPTLIAIVAFRVL